METNYSMEEIVSILRHNFYLYYKTLELQIIGQNTHTKNGRKP